MSNPTDDRVRLPGASSPDLIVRLECLRHGQHDAMSTLQMKCMLCHDSNRPGVVERRYVDESRVERLREALEQFVADIRLVNVPEYVREALDG
jgi:hypothetical protein